MRGATFTVPRHPLPEARITTSARSSWLSQGLVPEDEVQVRARERALELGCVPLSPAAGALLSVLAATLGARAVVEVGTCAGVAALWLLRRMPADGVLTTIEPHGELLRAARLAYAQAGLPAGRTRSIAGRAEEVMPRLADGAYDLVLIGGEPTAWFDHTREALRLLRPGGLVVVDGALRDGPACDPGGAPGPACELIGAVQADDRLLPALVPVGNGLLLAVSQEHGPEGNGQTSRTRDR